MYRGRSKLLPVVLVAIVAVVAIIAMVSLGRALLGGDDRNEPVDDSANRALLNTEADRGVRMTVRGPIVGDESFRSYEIEVTPIGRRMTIYQGYQREVLENERLDNSTAAYTEFVNALSRAGYTEEAEESDAIDDTEGACATGRLYTFERLQAQSVTGELWTTSCRQIAGSFRGNAVLIRDLFQDQIPNSQDLLREIDI